MEDDHSCSTLLLLVGMTWSCSMFAGWVTLSVIFEEGKIACRLDVRTFRGVKDCYDTMIAHAHVCQEASVACDQAILDLKTALDAAYQ